MSTVARISDDLVTRVNEYVRERMPASVAEVFANCFSDTLSTTLSEVEDGSLFMVTGDIPAMWLRDSTAQLTPYLHFLTEDKVLADTVVRISRRQLACIVEDPYANAFNAGPTGESDHNADVTDGGPWVWERKYEVDSLCYPIQLAHDIWSTTGRTEHLDEHFLDAARVIVDLWRRELHHETSAYRFQRLDAPESDSLSRDGRGPITAPTGLTWSGFRPSDDACVYGYNIPGNAFAAVELRHLGQLAAEVFGDTDLATDARELSLGIEEGLREFGTAATPAGDTVYAYEVDGRGSALMIDDANVPSLLSLPFIGWTRKDDALYLATREFLLSDANPFYFSGTHAAGVGSPHTPPGQVWPIALAIQGLTTDDPDEKRWLLDVLSSTHAGTDLMHESFSVDDPRQYTRPWFSWANAMFCELVLDVCGLRTHIREPQRALDTGEMIRQ
ncbi:glycoside hydrolase family 125 protein [Glaciihabitans sp. UYNi722]|uniref:glycoside hydrolase family 125 protein n=1 Tax=Glaciihabitans sp. UYNi722 TaxID=3156344 RepID=UPI0033975F36